MKIIANRSDEIRRKRKEWDDAAEASKKRYDDQYHKFWVARDDEFEAVAAIVTDKIGHLVPNLRVTVDTADWDVDSGRLKVRVASNDDRVHAKDKALSWDWSVKLDADGNIQKDSGSWSGLQACTREQLDDLRNTLEALEILNSMDWNTVLKHDLPKYSDYVTENPIPLSKRPDFEGQLFEAEIEEAIGQPILFQGRAPEYRGWYYAVTGQTDKQYRIINIPEYMLKYEDYRQGRTVQELIEHFSQYNTQRVMKTKFATMLAKPLTKWEDK